MGAKTVRSPSVRPGTCHRYNDAEESLRRYSVFGPPLVAKLRISVTPSNCLPDRRV